MHKEYTLTTMSARASKYILLNGRHRLTVELDHLFRASSRVLARSPPFISTHLPSQHRKFHLSHPTRVYKSLFPDLEIPEQTIPEFTQGNFKFRGSKAALIDAVTGRTLTFDQTKDSIWRLTSALVKQGLTKGDVVMMVSENTIDYIIMFHAVLTLGGTVTTCNPHYLAADVIGQVKSSNASYLFCSSLFTNKTKDVAAAMPCIKKVFTCGKEPGFVKVSELLTDDGTAYPTNVDTDLFNDTAILPYSSGTTGLPKGVMLTHRNEVANSLQVESPGYFDHVETLTHMALLPFYHIYGIIVHLITSLRIGQTSVVIPGFDPKLFLATIQKYNVGQIHLVPPIVMFLNKHPMVKGFNVSSLKILISGAAPLGKGMVTEFHDKYRHCALGQGYGLTETSPVITLNSMSTCKEKLASSGLIVNNTCIKILNSENEEVLPGEKGELYVHGPQVMKGYLNNQEATDKILDADRWLNTGDVGYIDEDGHLFVVDRVKELIKYKGLQVPPAELEDLLCSHTLVADAAVIGIPDDEAGELPKAFVVMKPGAKLSMQDLNAYVNERVVSYKRLRGGIELISMIPRSPAGKILRRQLKEQSLQ